MSPSENKSIEKPAEDFTRTCRYKVGLGMIIVGHGILLSGLLLPLLGVGTSIVGAAVLGGEVVCLASIAFLGKEGFKAIKSKAFALVKAEYAARVGAGRRSFPPSACPGGKGLLPCQDPHEEYSNKFSPRSRTGKEGGDDPTRMENAAGNRNCFAEYPTTSPASRS